LSTNKINEDADDAADSHLPLLLILSLLLLFFRLLLLENAVLFKGRVGCQFLYPELAEQ